MGHLILAVIFAALMMFALYFFSATALFLGLFLVWPEMASSTDVMGRGVDTAMLAGLCWFYFGERFRHGKKQFNVFSSLVVACLVLAPLVICGLAVFRSPYPSSLFNVAMLVSLTIYVYQYMVLWNRRPRKFPPSDRC